MLQTLRFRADTLANPGTVHHLTVRDLLEVWACNHSAGLPPPRAGNGTRTRDPNLGKVVLYQLSYSRERCTNVTEPFRDFYRRAHRTGMEARGIEPLTS